MERLNKTKLENLFAYNDLTLSFRRLPISRKSAKKRLRRYNNADAISRNITETTQNHNSPQDAKIILSPVLPSQNLQNMKERKDYKI
jgi:hypothetical protein